MDATVIWVSALFEQHCEWNSPWQMYQHRINSRRVMIIFPNTLKTTQVA